MDGRQAITSKKTCDPNLYTITKEITAVPGSVQEWKFKANPDENFNNNGWETAAKSLLLLRVMT